MVRSGTARRLALVGPTLNDVREVMIDGPSGLRSIGLEAEWPTYEVSRRRLKWRNGAVAHVFSAEEPERLRGPQFDAAWCDEIGAWANDAETWRMLAFGMRLGASPRVAATTTPRARELVRALAGLAERGAGGVVMTRAATRENARNLSPGFVSAMEEMFGGTRLGRQELEGELVLDPPGVLWTREMVEACRVGEAGEMERVVVAVDPPAGVGGDACGIVVAGLRAGVVYVLADATVRGLRPMAWAGRVAAAARRFGAGLVVAEANQGGEMVRAVLEAAGLRAGGTEGVRVKLRHAGRSKRDRAEPVAALYERGRVRHACVMRDLEDEMCAFGAEGERTSPDRVDALVWAVAELTETRAAPRVSLPF